ncbi:MAG TPA: hypothetical protein VFU57_00425 [Candidatus Acidoferrales bacterium]|nr:hypothetical protein [Candidatus Acidoferrales bacterium]
MEKIGAYEGCADLKVAATKTGRLRRQGLTSVRKGGERDVSYSLVWHSGPMEKIGPYVLEAGGWRLEAGKGCADLKFAATRRA